MQILKNIHMIPPGDGDRGVGFYKCDPERPKGRPPPPLAPDPPAFNLGLKLASISGLFQPSS